MAEKTLNSRIVHKHDIEVNWSKATNFIHKIGEIIVYDPDEDHAAARAKIGDGVKTVVELAFIDDAAKTALFKEIDMVEEKVEALSELVGDTSVQEQIEARINLLEDYIYPNYLINATTLKAHYDVHQVDREFGLFKEYRFEVEKLINVYDSSITRIEIENQGTLLGYFTSNSSISADGLTTEQTFTFTSSNPEYNLKDKIYTGFDFKYYDADNNIIDISSYTIPCYVRFCEATDSETILTLDEKLIPDTIARTEDIVQSDWNTNDENDLSYVKNRTHYVETLEIEWDGVIDGHLTTENHTFMSDAKFVKVSDFKITEQHQPIQLLVDCGEQLGIQTFYNACLFNKDGSVSICEDLAYYVPEDNFILEPKLNHHNQVIFPEKGLYFIYNIIPDGTVQFGKTLLANEVHQLNPKFIPTATEDQLISLLMDLDAFPAMTDSNGAIFTHKDSILLI